MLLFYMRMLNKMIRICPDPQNSSTQMHHYILHLIYTNMLSVLFPKFDREYFMEWTRDHRLRGCKMSDLKYYPCVALSIEFLQIYFLTFQQFSSDCHCPIISNVHTGFNDFKKLQEEEACMITAVKPQWPDSML